MKIVISSDVFDMSTEFLNQYAARKGLQVKAKDINVRQIPRNDPDLVAMVEEKNPNNTRLIYNPHEEITCEWFLRIIEIPDDVDWEICTRNDYEYVSEKHRTWY